MDHEFTVSWRNELLAGTWTALREYETESQKPFYTVLRFRADHPDLRSPELAMEVSELLGRDIKAGNIRVLVHRAREVFADLLVRQVESSLEKPSIEELENELITLDLLSYCRPALEKRRNGETP